MVRKGQKISVKVRKCQKSSEKVRKCQERSGKVKKGKERSEKVRKCQERSGKVTASMERMRSCSNVAFHDPGKLLDRAHKSRLILGGAILVKSFIFQWVKAHSFAH
jgi:hypothetical protein